MAVETPHLELSPLPGLQAQRCGVAGGGAGALLGSRPAQKVHKTVRTGRTPDESDFIEHDDSILWFTPGSFNDATLTLEAAKRVSNESVNEGQANIFSKDAVLVVGIGATLGKVGIPGDACSGNQQINAIESSGKLMPRFLGLFLSAAQGQMRISSNASTLGIMNQQKAKELVVNCPPLLEQEQIVFHTEKALWDA